MKKKLYSSRNALMSAGLGFFIYVFIAIGLDYENKTLLSFLVIGGFLIGLVNTATIIDTEKDIIVAPEMLWFKTKIKFSDIEKVTVEKEKKQGKTYVYVVFYGSFGRKKILVDTLDEAKEIEYLIKKEISKK